jgi:general secretion pathway protein J
MKRNGFTLLELIVAMSIFTIIAAATYSMFDSARSVSTRAEFRAQLFQTARAALQAIEEDLRGAVMPANAAVDTGFISTNSGSEKEAVDKLEFFTATRHTASAYDVNATDVVRGGDVSKVTYWVEPDLKRPAHGLVRERPKELTPPSGPVHRDEDVQEVAPDVVYVNFRFFDNGQWLDTWDSTQVRKLPKAVEVTITVRGEWRDEEILEPFMTRVYLPVGGETPEKTQ